MASALDFRPAKSLGTCRMDLGPCVGTGGVRQRARFRFAICGHPVLDEFGREVGACTRCRAKAEKLWAEALDRKDTA